jgi:Mlc titration factor MtfA (ptsG expression regulator)
MKLIIFFLIAGGVVWAIKVFASARRQQKRRALLSTPFPSEWSAILTANLPPYQKISPQLQQQLHDYIRIFISEKSFEGCGGLTLTDEIKVTIAAQACMLLLNRESDCYPKLYSIVVYPSTYVTGTHKTYGSHENDTSVRLGESWKHGTVVLAWDSVKRGALNYQDGLNVVMHEFAHQLDQEDGNADGAPILEMHSAYSAWSRTFSEEYEVLQKLKKKHPELYHELQGFYKVNPIEWDN